MSVFEALLDIDAALVAAGVPPLSPYWKEEARRFYSAPVPLLVEVVGRGGDKSRTSVKLAIAETLAGDFTIPPGELHYFTHIAENMNEAKKTLAILERYLRILEIGFAPKGDTIELEGQPRGFKVLAARVGAVSGWRALGWTVDEAAKHGDEVAEVVASIRAMTVTHPRARGRMFSSPMGKSGFFYETWSSGSPDVMTGQASTWAANPSVTEEQTRKLELHEPTWRREYGGEFSGTANACFDPDAVDKAFAYRPGLLVDVAAKCIAADPSGRGSDNFAWLVGGWTVREQPEDQLYECDEENTDRAAGYYCLRFDLAGRRIPKKDIAPPRRVLLIDSLSIASADYKARTSAEEIYRAIAATARSRGVRLVCTDQFESWSGESHLKNLDLEGRTYTWSAATKGRAISRLRSYLYSESVYIAQEPLAAQLRRELIGYQEKISGAGITYGGRDASGGHNDLVSCLLTLMMADEAGDLQGAPANNRRSGAMGSTSDFGSSI